MALVVAAAVEDPTVLDACSEEYAKLADAAKRQREILEKSPSSVTNSTLTRATTGSASRAATNRSRRDPRIPEETSRRSASYADMQTCAFVRMSWRSVGLSSNSCAECVVVVTVAVIS